MASVVQVFFVLHLSFVLICCVASKPSPQPYIIYMGSSFDGSRADDHTNLQLLSSIVPSEESERINLLSSYNHAFKGFSAMLTEDEASLLAGYEGVLSVFPDPILKLHTTRSWDFLEAADSQFRSSRHYKKKTTDVIVGIIDTGIWPESPSFNDQGIGKIPSKWKGVCMEGSDFKKSNCNRKLIGARFYTNRDFSSKPNETSPTDRTHGLAQSSPRDSVGHGSHTASIAAGMPVADASYYGLARGTARGGSPSARIASYKACSLQGCPGSTLLKAIDDAIKDGVDLISISIGVSVAFQSDFLSDPIAIGAFHAEQMGVMVICSAGNDGPAPYTIVNTAPWIFTVAASTIDRDFQSTVLLGNNKTYKANAINFSLLNHWKTYPLAFGEQVAGKFTPASDARNCIPGSLDYKKAFGKIIVCLDEYPTVSRRIKKLVVEDTKAKGVIIIDGSEKTSPYDSGTYPFAEVGQTIGSQILSYINSTKYPTATILPTTEIRRFKPAPVVASFSSRGPGGLTEYVLKPDITAPGVAILAAIVPKLDAEYDSPGNKPSFFGIRSGTSMACPHVTGAMAFVKSVHPEWTSSMIRSALMTTASISNNMGKPLTNSSAYYSNPHEIGVGGINPMQALDPGLVFETTKTDYLNFLCHYGYKQKIVQSMSSNRNFHCPRNIAQELISNINYPTISIGRLNKNEGVKRVRRFVTNVGSPNATYVSSVHAPRGLLVKVLPEKLRFTEGMRRASFEVVINGRQASKGYSFGAIRWSDGLHVVRVVFAVNVEEIIV